MSNGEVKRWTLLRVADDEFYLDEGDRPDFEHSKIKVMRVEDHERVVAEERAYRDKRIASIEAKYKELHDIAIGQADTADRNYLALQDEMCQLKKWNELQTQRNSKLQGTIAKQAKVIEKLREQRDIELEDNCWDDASTGGRPFEQTRAMMEAEIEAINKLEDIKKV